MVDGIIKLVPTAKVGHVGIYRDPNTLNPIEYYSKLPFDISKREVIVLDPMLATGFSAVKTIDILKENNVKNIKFMCIVAAPEGIKVLSEKHPDIKIYCASLDKTVKTIDILKENNVKNIKFMCIVAAPEGIKVLSEKHPDIKIYCASLDKKLNEYGYIIPGLGDTGDRIFGTK